MNVLETHRQPLTVRGPRGSGGLDALSRSVLGPVVGLLLIAASRLPRPGAGCDESPAWAAAISGSMISHRPIERVDEWHLRMDVTGTESSASTDLPIRRTRRSDPYVQVWELHLHTARRYLVQPGHLAIVKIAATIDLSIGSLILKSRVSIAGPPATIQWPLTPESVGFVDHRLDRHDELDGCDSVHERAP